MATNKKELVLLAQQMFGREYAEEVERKVSEGDFKINEGWEEYLELDWGQPGDIDPRPCLVFCSRSFEAGAVTARTYQYLAGINWTDPKSA